MKVNRPRKHQATVFVISIVTIYTWYAYHVKSSTSKETTLYKYMNCEKFKGRIESLLSPSLVSVKGERFDHYINRLEKYSDLSKGSWTTLKWLKRLYPSCFKKYSVKPTCYTAEKLIPQEFGKMIDVPLAQYIMEIYLKSGTQGIQPLHEKDSVLDVGSGPGAYLKFFHSKGFQRAAGIENANFGELAYYDSRKDFRKGPIQLQLDMFEEEKVSDKIKCAMDVNSFTLVFSLEVAEHIPREKHCDFINLLSSLTNNCIIFSAGHIGQGGSGHISNRNILDWQNEWLHHGYTVDIEKTCSLRKRATLKWFKSNLSVFCKLKTNLVPVDCETDTFPVEPFENYYQTRVWQPENVSDLLIQEKLCNS